MKRLFLGLLALSVLTTFSSCDKIKQAKDAIAQAAEGIKGVDVDYRMFENQEATKKMFDEIVAKMGEQAKVTDDVDFSISRRAHEGSIKRAGEPDELYITINTQDPKVATRIQQIKYWSNSGGWKAPEQMEVNVIGGNKETFRLEDELWDFNDKVQFDILYKVMTDAFAKYKDTEKYGDSQYIKRVAIKKRGYEVTIYGKLAANEQEKSNYYKADFTGKGK